MNFVDLNRMGKKAVSVKYELQKLASLKSARYWRQLRRD